MSAVIHAMQCPVCHRLGCKKCLPYGGNFYGNPYAGDIMIEEIRVDVMSDGDWAEREKCKRDERLRWGSRVPPGVLRDARNTKWW